jgi:hypothetical protein
VQALGVLSVETFGDGLLVAAVDQDTGVISALDDLTSQVISQSPPLDISLIFALAATQTGLDGRFLFVTGYEDGLIRKNMPDSGELIREWRGL